MPHLFWNKTFADGGPTMRHSEEHDWLLSLVEHEPDALNGQVQEFPDQLSEVHLKATLAARLVDTAIDEFSVVLKQQPHV